MGINTYEPPCHIPTHTHTTQVKVMSESRVTWATSSCANFNLPRLLCSRVRPDVRDRQTDRRQTKSSLTIPTYPHTHHYTLHITHHYKHHDKLKPVSAAPYCVLYNNNVQTTNERQSQWKHY